MDEIRVLIVDDHAVVREGLAAMFALRSGVTVVGEAENGREAIRLVEKLAPDVVIMDLQMPEMDGVAATEAIRQQNPDARILALSSFNERDRIAAIMAAGACGYLLKNSGADQLIQAIRTVHSGQLVFSPTAVQTLSSAVCGQMGATAVPSLTPREQEVLCGIADGLTNQAIAAQLGISRTTVRAHVSAILAKLNAANRTQAALLAQNLKLV